MRYCLIIAAVLFLLFTGMAFPEEFQLRGLGVNVNYPGVGMKYAFGSSVAEFRLQSLSETDTAHDNMTSLYGLRYYNYFSSLVYIGAELSSLSYIDNTDGFTASGVIAGIFMGVEKSVSGKMSVCLDLGPYFAQSAAAGVSLSLSDIVMNMSFNYYFNGIE